MPGPSSWLVPFKIPSTIISFQSRRTVNLNNLHVCARVSQNQISYNELINYSKITNQPHVLSSVDIWGIINIWICVYVIVTVASNTLSCQLSQSEASRMGKVVWDTQMCLCRWRKWEICVRCCCAAKESYLRRISHNAYAFIRFELQSNSKSLERKYLNNWSMKMS